MRRPNFVLDIEDERLWKDDTPVPIGKKAFQLMRLFADNQGRLLTKDQILAEVWGEIWVSDGLVKEYVHDLRVALGDNPKQPRFIETVRGRGYRFLGGVDQTTDGSGDRAQAMISDTHLPSLAVLPFTNLSGDPDQEYFADGLSEDLIASLSHVPWIFVIARNSSFTYTGLTIDVRKIGAELGVRYLLDGSVRRAENRVRVTAELIDTETGNHIWADQFDGVLEDIFDLQDTITREVVAAMAPKIEMAEIARASLKHPHSLTAYDYYLRARAELNNLKIAKAAALLEQAIAASPDYAKAKAVRAWCYTLYGWRDILAIEDDRDTAINLADEALASPNADSQTAAYAGYTIAFMRSAVERGMRLVEEATVQCPSFAWAWASLALLELYYRDAARAIELAKIALRLNPRDPQSFRAEMAIAGAYYNLDQFEQCLKYCEQSLSKAPDIQFFIVFRIACLVHMNRLEEAHTVAQRFIERRPNFTVSRWGALTRSSPDASKIARMKEALLKAGLPE
jgi:adenylate cyclase